jgi:DNA-directed RNA polymerase subunit K/omega
MASRTTYDHHFEDALKMFNNNRFLLSVILSKRVAQLRKGAEPLIDAKGIETHEEIVFLEIIQEKLEWRQTNLQEDTGDMEEEFSTGDFGDEGD